MTNAFPMQENLENNNGGGQPSKQPLEKNQKIALAGLSVIAVFFVVMWMVQLNKKINDPFSIGDETALTNSAPQEDANSEAVLKAKDTDGDGLNDWDELNVYKTSPYLADTDSDGIPDGAEVKNGTDPNCPEGRDCSKTGVLENANASSSLQLAPQSNSIDAINTLLSQLSAQATGTSSPAQTNSSQNLLGGKADVASLRKALLDSGLNQKILNALTDQQLLQSYQDTLKNANQSVTGQ